MYDVWDTDRAGAVKEKASKKAGLDVNDVDLVYSGTRLDDDHQWWQAQGSRIYMCRR